MPSGGAYRDGAERITIVGDGVMATARGTVLAECGWRPRLWGLRPEHLDEMPRTRGNARFLPGAEAATAERRYRGMGGPVVALLARRCLASSLWW